MYNKSPIFFLMISILLIYACDDQQTQSISIDQSIDARLQIQGDHSLLDHSLLDHSLLDQNISVVDLNTMLNGIELQITGFPFSLSLRTEAQSMLISGTELGIGEIVGRAYDEAKHYDPYLLHFSPLGITQAPPSALTWYGIKALLSYRAVDFGTAMSEEGDLPPAFVFAGERGQGYELRVLFDNHEQGTLKISQSATHSIQLTLLSDQPMGYYYFQKKLLPNENFYGMGEHYDQVARRGTYQSTVFQLLPQSESKYNEMHVPVPLLISTEGNGYFLQNTEPAYVDIGYQKDDILRIEVGRPNPMRLHLLLNNHPFDALKSYFDITGKPLIPPYWSFAPHFWRNETIGEQEVLSDLAELRSRHIPAGVFWIDRPYERAYNDCVFDPNRYTDPVGMGEKIKKQGFKLILWHAPYTKEESDFWDACVQANAFVTGPQVFLNFGRLMDFTNPLAFELWQQALNRFNEAVDVAGYKLDYAEDIQVAAGSQRLHFSFFDGSNELKMHHGYALHYHRTYLNSLDDFENDPTGDLKKRHLKNGFIMGRSSTFGGQRLAHALWPGDLDSDFHRHLEDGYWVGGLPASVVANLSLSASGFPFYAADTGGFRNGRPTQDVLIRWAWQTALSPIMQIGGGGSSHFPWDAFRPGEESYDEQAVIEMRKATQLNMRLADYRYTWALKAVEGIPLTRPFGMMYPKDGRHPSDQYFLGPDLLVAPIISSDHHRSIAIPEGIWRDYWQPQSITGPTTIEVTQALDGIPLYIRKGAIIPLLDPRIMTLNAMNPDFQDDQSIGRQDQAGILSFLIYHELNQHYLNHDGTQVTLGHQSILIEPSMQNPLNLPSYEQFQVELLLDEINPTLQYTLNTVQLAVVDQASFETGCHCIWLDNIQKKAVFRLPPHFNELQLIEWQ